MTGQCKEFCQKLSDYLDGRLEEDVCVLIEQHLEVCPPCGLMYESLKTAVEICRKGVSDEIPEQMARELKEYLRAHCLQSDH